MDVGALAVLIALLSISFSGIVVTLLLVYSSDEFETITVSIDNSSQYMSTGCSLFSYQIQTINMALLIER